MFRRLRARMTLFNAGTTVVLIVLLRLTTVLWLEDAFIDVADATLATRVRTTLAAQQLPLPPHLSAVFARNDDPDATTPLRDTPALILGVVNNVGAIGTYALLADAQGALLPGSDAALPYPLNTPALDAAHTNAQNLDIRTVTDRNGNSVRIHTYALPDNSGRYIQVGRPMADYDALKNRLRVILFLGGMVGAVVVILTAWVLSGVFVKPTAVAYERQRDFISNASHELRTPLSIVRASAQLAQLDVPPGSPVAELLEAIVAENRHMTTTIENLLTIARTQDHIATVNPYDLTTVLQDATAAARRIAPDRVITYSAPPRTVTVAADPHYVGHIVRILLDNAIAHTPTAAHITVTCTTSTSGIEVRVADTGPGIPADHVSTIFEPFVTYARGTGHRGSGIGLHIAATFASAMRATLRYEPNVPHGACFVLRLPL